jgi:hypothetical protein
MNFPKFGKKQTKKPPLVPESTQEPKAKVETLKAGRLATLALELADTLIGSFGPRVSGSKAGRDTASRLGQELKKFCDTTEYKEFPVHPLAYTLWLKLLVIVYPAALLLLWVGLPASATVLLGLFVWYVFRQFVVFRPVGDAHTPESTGANVHGVIEPEGDVRTTVIFSGHHDSARLYRYNTKDRMGYARNVLLPVLLFALLCLSSGIQLVTEIFSGTLFSFNVPPVPSMVLDGVLLLCIPLVIPLWSFVTDEGSPGAGDNLVSSCMGVELARFFDWRKRCASPLEHTRLVFASFDGEEIGLKGSRQWFGEHASGLGNAIQLNFDCPYSADELTFLYKDVNGMQPLSLRLSSRCVEIARSMGYEATSQAMPFLAGGTDAAEGARSGIESCTLTAMGWDDVSKPAVYHTKDDVCSAIDPKAIEQAISVAIRLVELVDGGRLYEEVPPASEGPEDPVPELRFGKLSIR